MGPAASHERFSETLLAEVVLLTTTTSGDAIRGFVQKRQVQASSFDLFCASKARVVLLRQGVTVESPLLLFRASAPLLYHLKV